MNAPSRPGVAYEAVRDEHGTVVTADASKVTPSDFYRLIHAERFFRDELARQIDAEQDAADKAGDGKAWGAAARRRVALHCNLPLDHFDPLPEQSHD